jgi:hypothetical protein
MEAPHADPIADDESQIEAASQISKFKQSEGT